MPTQRVADDSLSKDTAPPSGEGAAQLAAHTRIGVAILGVAAASACLLVVASWLADTPSAAGGAHPDVPQMQHGGPGADRGGALLAVGALFGTAQIAFFGLCFALGMRRRDGLRALRIPLFVGLGLYVGVWLLVVLSYATYAADPAAAGRWLGFPIPTAILLFGFWPFPIYFLVLYLRYFAQNVMSAETLATFRARVEALRASGHLEDAD